MLASAFGWTHQDILKLTVRQFMRYLDEIPKVTARQQIRGLEVSSYPHMEERGRKNVDRYYSRILRPITQRDIDSAWDSLKSMKGGKSGSRRNSKRKTSS